MLQIDLDAWEQLVVESFLDVLRFKLRVVVPRGGKDVQGAHHGGWKASDRHPYPVGIAPDGWDAEVLGDRSAQMFHVP